LENRGRWVKTSKCTGKALLLILFGLKKRRRTLKFEFFSPLNAKRFCNSGCQFLMRNPENGRINRPLLSSNKVRLKTRYSKWFRKITFLVCTVSIHPIQRLKGTESLFSLMRIGRNTLFLQEGLTFFLIVW